MPINIPDALPAKDILESEKIFAIEDKSAHRQRIRPLKIVILNLMPKKIETETQILRLISKSALQVDIDFMMVKNHVSKNTSQDHLVKFYTYFEKLKDNYYDGMIITGAPVEHLEYEEMIYIKCIQRKALQLELRSAYITADLQDALLHEEHTWISSSEIDY